MRLTTFACLSASAWRVHSQYVHSPPPPYGLPPWSPGMAPPVPGPVFSPAFNALLVLLAIGCVVAGLDFKQRIAKIYGTEIGEENELHTRGNPGHAQWLKGIQKTEGRHRGCAMAVAVEPKPKAKSAKPKKGRKAPVPDSAVDDDDDDDVEMASLQGKGKKGKKGRGKR